jgi:hypothetical protein
MGVDEPEAARVVSASPGRLRLRLPRGAASRDRLAAAADDLGGRAGVTRAEARWRTGSLLVDYDPAAAEAVWSALGELGLARPAVPAARAEGSDPEAARVLGALTRANTLVARRTNGTDLRTLVPVGLGMLALRQLVRGDQRLADAPWYILAWYASETFQEFHARRRGK